MSDSLRTETLIPRTIPNVSEGFIEATRTINRGLRQYAVSNEEMTLDAILNKVYDWENQFEGKVSADEVEALQTLSLMLGMVKHKAENSGSNIDSVRKHGIEVEHEVLRTLFNNLGEDGKPNEIIARSFSLISNVFDEYFDPLAFKLKDKGVVANGVWVGAMGAITTSLIFHNMGWEVRLPPIELDLKYEADLLVKDKNGKLYAVDITARTPNSDKSLSNDDEIFSVVTGPVPPQLDKEFDGLSGVIKVRVPPLMSRESDTFYENRRTGYPNERSIAKFKGMLNI